MPYASLKTLREQIKKEIRVLTSTDKSRYRDDEIDLAINRAVLELERYFWHTELYEGASFAAHTFEYTLGYPVRDIYQVEFTNSDSNPVRIADDWDEDIDPEGGTVLRFFSDHRPSDLLIRYERHPIAYPPDLVLGNIVNHDHTSIRVDISQDVYLWPPSGYLEINNEVIKYGSITLHDSGLSLGEVRFDTITRAALGSTAPKGSITSPHTEGSAVSFVNVVDKAVFFEGVRERAISILNRIRILDAAPAEVQGYVTIMREIEEAERRWILDHRQRSLKPLRNHRKFTKPSKRRWLRY